MSLSRELLKSLDPELGNALEQSWEIAQKDIFPAMYSSDESINSQPHSQNLENYLDNILKVHPELFDNKNPVNLSPYELYCILMAIQFHDIGRIKSDEGHGYFSKHYIINNYQIFCIPSIELADAIGDICELHKPLGSLNQINYSSVLLDAGKGRIRTRELSDLLKLVDEMDSSYRRLKNLYILDQPKYYGGKGLFRNYIKGISYDRHSQAIIVSIDNKLIINTEIRLNKGDYITFKRSDQEINHFAKYNYKNDLLEFINQEIPSEQQINQKSIYRYLYEQILDDKNFLIEQNFNETLILKIKKFLEKEKNKQSVGKAGIIDELLIISEKESNNQFFKQFYCYLNYFKTDLDEDLKIDIESAANQKWPYYIVIALIQRAIKECEFKSIESSNLSRFGIKIKKWLLYYKEHLFDTSGKETIEPLLDTNYLIKVTTNMWYMSTRSWGKIWISFEDLSYKILERDLTRLKMAIQRIDILMRPTAHKNNLTCCFDYDNEEWCWFREGSNYIHLEKVIEKINSITNPL